MNTDNKIIGTGLLTAIAASLCCITPVLALIAGTSGLASTFSWLEPFRPFFIGLTILVLGFAWYQKLKPKTQIDCKCETEEKPKFIQTKMFLGIVTSLAIVMLAFPYFSSIFYPKTEKQIIVVDKSNIQKVEFAISGMTCASCEEHVNYAVNKLPGIINSPKILTKPPPRIFAAYRFLFMIFHVLGAPLDFQKKLNNQPEQTTKDLNNTQKSK
jgi:mercuric ion transport protein